MTNTITRRAVLVSGFISLASASLPDIVSAQPQSPSEARKAADFLNPPDTARPWVYWYFMDGNLTREGMTADLEALKSAGLGGAIYLEVGIGVPRGPVEFMSEPWQQLLGHAFHQAERLGLAMALTTGPGWCGSGGPWVKPENSMQHLVFAELAIHGPSHFDQVFPQPKPRTPFFGEETLSPELHALWKGFYIDVLVLAFPTPLTAATIPFIDEKALYTRGSYSSQIPGPYSSLPTVRPFFDPSEVTAEPPPSARIDRRQIVNLTSALSPDGRLHWQVPPGQWTVMRFGRTITGQTTRPAPAPGLGLECDKFDQASVDLHFDSFIGSLLRATGDSQHRGVGLTTLHFDSWEMSSQNWSATFQHEFAQRRNYDPVPFLPTFAGHVVESREASERFLWDIRQTAQELVLQNHALRLRQLGAPHHLELALEPYDLNPCADLSLGTAADIPMGEFWSKGYDAKTDFSIIEATSIGHTNGKKIIGAEAFTAEMTEHGHQYPGRMKEQGDWALCAGINRFVFHRYQAQPWLDRAPGMMMGPDGGYGVQWQRTQTWWDFASAYHLYLTRCQHMLRRGLFVADILYLALEGAPCVFLPPDSATLPGILRDRRGYNFDGCAPETLLARASVRNGQIVFPDGMSYRLLVLPRSPTMTPELLAKVVELVEQGATLLGAPPRRSPSLVNYPACDAQVMHLSGTLWGTSQPPGHYRVVGKGRVFFDSGANATQTASHAHPELYPSYQTTAAILSSLGIQPDFEGGDHIRYTHRRDLDEDIYFLANATDQMQSTTCRFRVTGLQPHWWNPLTGTGRPLPEFNQQAGSTSVPLRFEPHESGFVVFRKRSIRTKSQRTNHPEYVAVTTVPGPWKVDFDPKRGGPGTVDFPQLEDWTKRPEPGIRFYSGKASYHATFDLPATSTAAGNFFISLGSIRHLASVQLNGQPLGILWCSPWRIAIPANLLRTQGNRLTVTVANLWINRLIGDSALPPAERIAWTTSNPFHPDSPLEESGLLGPVTLLLEQV